MRRLLLLAAILVAVGLTDGPARSSSPDFEADRWNLERVGATSAWDDSTGRGAVVAVVDSGIDWRHPEFGGGNPHTSKLVDGASCRGAASVEQCTRAPQSWLDENGHGTHVAGVVAAPRNGAYVAGVAPDAEIMPVRVLDAGARGTARDVATGILYAVAQDADVINLSVSGLPGLSLLADPGLSDDAVLRALRAAADAGILVVVAAGNDGLPVCAHAALGHDEILCVGAIDARNQRAAYSNAGVDVDLVAPGGSALLFCGEGILSTHLIETASTCADHTPGLTVLSGTSMAAPHVAGVGALLHERGVRGDAAAVRILATAVDLGAPGRDPVYGDGRVDAARAVDGNASSFWQPLAF